MRGSAITARRPRASTAPSTEFCSSLLTTSAPGRLARVTEMTSSTSVGGATFGPRRLENRSMISAIAAMEQRSSGQIGQPAACMIENNPDLSAGERVFGTRDYGAMGSASKRVIGVAVVDTTVGLAQSTACVDN